MNKIAILGMGCLFPGYSDKNIFWDKLLNNELFTMTENFKGRHIERGGLPKQPSNMNRLLKNSFGDKVPVNLDSLGEVYKWSCYVCSEALNESGYRENADVLKKTGLVMGTLSMPTRENSDILRPVMRNNMEMTVCDLLEDTRFVFHSPMENEGLDPAGAFSDTEPTAVAAGVLSLGGPTLTFNAACASPLYGIKLASLYLNARKADLMIAGSSCSNEHVKGNCGLFDILGVLCDQNKSRPFDRNTEGLIAASGAGAFVLKRLEDAVRDGDQIIGVIESIGWSNDAGSKSILAPAIDGQTRALSDAYKEGISCDVDYIECHATGTKAGDLVELETLSRFFKPKGVQPKLGALKASMGHFFTASANASVAKVLLSMKHGIIPATVRINDPIESSDGYFSGESLILENKPWTSKKSKKRAGINAFGFGGINAHMVLSEFKPEEINEEKQKEKLFRCHEPEPVAIVGMGVHIGKWSSIDEFFDALAKGKSDWQEPDTQRWRGMERDARRMESLGLSKMPKGAYINNFPFDFIKFKLPPKENPYLIRRDLLLLNVAAQALEDANIKQGEYRNTAVIISCSQDFSDLRFMSSEERKDEILKSLAESCSELNQRQLEEVFNILRENEIKRETPDTVTGIIPNIRANRISAHWRFEGPSFILLERENSLARSLEIARLFLSEGIVDCVVVGTVEFAGELEHIFVQKETGKLQNLQEKGIGEGAAVLVLKRKEQAEKDENRIYSLIEGVSLSGGACDSKLDAAVTAERLEACIGDSLRQAHIKDGEIGHIDLPNVLYEEEGKETEEIYFKQYPSFINDNDITVGSVESVTGCCFSLTPVVSVIKNSLQLYYKVKFPQDDKSGLTPWVCYGERRSAISGSFTQNGNCAQIVLTDYQKPSDAEQCKGGFSSFFLLPVCAASEDELLDKLDRLSKAAAGNKGMKRIAADMWTDYNESKDAKQLFTFSILCTSKETLLEEIRNGKIHIKKAFMSGKEWKSPKGSCFSPRPLGRNGKVVWMCPPGGMVSIDKICDILRVYPDLRGITEFHRKNSAGIQDMPLKAQEFFFSKYIMEFFTTKLTAEMLRSKAGISPDIAIGASMGEIALSYALDCLDFGTLKNDLFGSLLKVFEVLEDQSLCEKYFGHPVKEWESWYIKQSRAEVEAVLADESKAFITIVGSPTDLIISGEKEACSRVLKRLTGYRMRMEGSLFVHTPVASGSYDSLYKMELETGIHIKRDLPYSLYSTCAGKPLAKTNKAFSENIANILTRQVDFQSVLNRVYEDGGRVFIDLGTNGLCAMWAENTLYGKDALVLSLHSAQHSFEESWCRCLAGMLSHNLPLSLKNPYYFSKNEMDGKPEYIKMVSTGLPHHSTDIATRENHSRIMALAQKQTSPEKLTNQDKSMLNTPSEDTSWGFTMPSDVLNSSYNRAAIQNVHAYLLYQSSEARLTKYIRQQLQNALNEINLLSQTHSEAVAVKEIKPCIWDYDEVLEMTNGSVSKVLGPQYAEVDTYPVRARMPSPPFLFVTRITKIDAELGSFRPSRIEMEYDIGTDCIYIVGNKVSPLVLTESGHIGIFLVGYLGIDIVSKGKLRYRIADTKTTFHDELPGIGETIRGVLEIKSFPKNGDTMLVTYRYNCYHKDRILMTMDAIGGFFTEQDLENSKGLPPRHKPSLQEEPLKINFTPYIPCEKIEFDKDDMKNFYDGKFEACFALRAYYYPFSKDDYLTSTYVRMIDTIKTIHFSGGLYGLGEVIGEKYISTDHWAFNAHFKNDPIFPGTLMLDGINQVLMFFIVYSGVHVEYGNLNMDSMKGTMAKGMFRGQVEKIPSLLRFHIHIKDIREKKDSFSIAADADVYWQDKNILRSENICVVIKRNENPKRQQGGGHE